ncbi:MAG: flagellar basal body-associated FliL family protein [Cellvibrionaceae bacterium]|nr:flagellar basal body-associated FliL family protein [Cellvibrionaceae bacterium]
MAEEEGGGAETEEAAQGGSKKRLILLIVLILVIAGISVGGTLAAIKFLGDPPPPPEGAEVEEAEEAAPVMAPAIYYPIKPEIIVTYQARGRQRYMQAEVNLLVRDDSVIEAVELHMPMVRNALNMIIGSQAYEDIQTAEGKELMRQQCLQELQKIIEKETGDPGIEQVLFTNLILQ